MSVSTTANPYLGAIAYTDILQMYAKLTRGKLLFVDGTNGSDDNDGLTEWSNAKATIQAAVTAASAFDTILIAAKAMAAGSSDPGSYAEKVIIPATTEGLELIGVSRGRTQGGLPQIKFGGSTTGALLTIRAPGCLIKNIGFNGVSSAGAALLNGIFLDDDSGLAAGSGGETKSAFGTTIEGCHFKNCAGSTVTDAATGGAIMWGTYGGAWQVLIKGNRFYKNVADISMRSTEYSVPQDIIIEDNIMSGPAGNVHINIYVGASGVNGLIINNNVFGQLPTLGTNPIYIKLDASTVGMISNCIFGCATNVSGTPKTFKSGGSGADFPTTVHLVGCFGQSITAAEAYGAIITIA